MSESKEEGVGVVKYDRALLKANEVQPVKEVDGHAIVVNKYGQFAAKVGEVDISGDRLREVEDKVHATHLALLRKKEKKVLAVPAFILNEDHGDRWHGDAFFRGVHAGNGALQFTRPDGSNGFSDRVVVWPRDHEDIEKVRALADEIASLKEALAKAEGELRPLVEEQKGRMFRGLATGWSKRPTVRNDAAKANEIADAIVRNVLRERSS